MEDDESQSEDASEGGEEAVGDGGGPGAQLARRSQLRELNARDSGPGAQLEQRSAEGQTPAAQKARKKRSAQREALRKMIAVDQTAKGY